MSSDEFTIVSPISKLLKSRSVSFLLSSFFICVALLLTLESSIGGASNNIDHINSIPTDNVIASIKFLLSII